MDDPQAVYSVSENPYPVARHLLGDGRQWVKKVCMQSHGEKPPSLCLVAALVRASGSDWPQVKIHVMGIIEARHPGRFKSIAGYNDASNWQDVSDTLAQGERSFG